MELQRYNQWTHIKIQCLPAEFHNSPKKIPAAVTEMIEKYRPEYENIFVAYADCGTGGALDTVLRKYQIERLPGAHCYEFFTGSSIFADLSAAEPGTFYLTDFLVRHFDRLVKVGLGLDRHPELRSQYFGNYRRVVHLAQEESEELSSLAQAHGKYLGLDFYRHYTGLVPVGKLLQENIIRWQN